MLCHYRRLFLKTAKHLTNFSVCTSMQESKDQFTDFIGLYLDPRWWYPASLGTEVHTYLVSPVNREDEVRLPASFPLLKIVPLLVYGPFNLQKIKAVKIWLLLSTTENGGQECFPAEAGPRRISLRGLQASLTPFLSRHTCSSSFYFYFLFVSVMCRLRSCLFGY